MTLDKPSTLVPMTARGDDDAVVSRSVVRNLGLTPWDAGALLVCLLLMVAFAPPLIFEGWTPRMAIVLGVTPVGVVLLIGLCRRADRSALLLAAALLWTILISVLSQSPRSALVGSAGRDLSALTVIGAGGCWALGRSMTTRGRSILVGLFVWVAAAGAAIGVLQVLVEVTSGPLALASGRPTGLLINPVYFGAICASGLAVAVARLGPSTWRSLATPVLLLGIGTSLSGSRVALAAALAALVACAAVHRTRWAALGSLVGVVSLALGVVVDRAFGAGRNAADRLAESSGGGRFTVWGYGLQSWWERPIRGYGFGRFRPAVQARFSEAFVADHASNDVSQAWFDAHNVVIATLVAVGIVGTVLLIAWAVVWGRRVRGPLTWALLVLLLHWLMQPMSLVTLPLAMVLFAVAVDETEPIVPDTPNVLHGAALVVGLLLGGSLIGGDVVLQRAADDLNGDRAALVAEAFGDDPVMSDVVAQVYELDPDVVDREDTVLEWRTRTAQAEPDRPYWWSLLAMAQIDAGRFDEAEVSLARAFRLQPNNVRAVQTEALLALRLEDEVRLGRLFDRLCRLGQPECGLDARELIERFRQPTPASNSDE